MCLITQVFKKQNTGVKCGSQILAHLSLKTAIKSLEISGIMPVKLAVVFLYFQTDEDRDRGYKTTIVMVFGWMCDLPTS